ncbi:SDR family NAD(P)-dependent oxidoreductase [Halomarina pelagica]|uniref:SDR family NAD(P)-dependent oxidoreductase n=1 Tax=Halomarina pelagica TaxID=2961599 RepID=UPI0020C5A6AA|nr:SDR family NAD(P)-dependent oxidoreductase [Halomarina sp. BND7]
MDDLTAVVTGASRGIGASVARLFANEGAYVALCARDDGALASVVEGIETDGGRATGLRADVRDEFDLERLMEVAAREGDGIDLLVPCAGVYHGSPGETPLAGESYSAFDDHLRTNGRGVYAAIREAVPHLNGGARVLVPSGSVARDARPEFGSYAVSKALAEAVARQFAAELDAAVGVVDPGTVSTALAGGDGRDPDAVAAMFRWAAVDAPDEDVDGRVLDLGAWRRATR